MFISFNYFFVSLKNITVQACIDPQLLLKLNDTSLSKIDLIGNERPVDQFDQFVFIKLNFGNMENARSFVRKDYSFFSYRLDSFRWTFKKYYYIIETKNNLVKFKPY